MLVIQALAALLISSLKYHPLHGLTGGVRKLMCMASLSMVIFLAAASIYHRTRRVRNNSCSQPSKFTCFNCPQSTCAVLQLLWKSRWAPNNKLPWIQARCRRGRSCNCIPKPMCPITHVWTTSIYMTLITWNTYRWSRISITCICSESISLTLTALTWLSTKIEVPHDPCSFAYSHPTARFTWRILCIIQLDGSNPA